MKEYKYILFDLDGTVTDPGVGITGSVMYALRALESRRQTGPSCTALSGRRLRTPSGIFTALPRRRQGEALSCTGSTIKTGAFSRTRFMRAWRRCWRN